MFKLIIKNLWSRRKRNGWLLAELILVTVVAWVIIDPLVMAVVVKTTPYGYDTDRLVDISMDSYFYGMSGYDESQTDSASLAENAMRIYNRLKSNPQIESVTRKNYNGLGGTSYSSNSFKVDTVYIMSRTISFTRGDNYFTTHGIKSLPGSPSAEELSTMSYASPGECVITESLAKLMFPSVPNPIGHYLNENIEDFQPGEWDFKVAGVVEDVRPDPFQSVALTIFSPREALPLDVGGGYMVRLKPGVDSRKFARELKENHADELKAGNYYLSDAEAQEEILEETCYSAGWTNTIRLKAMLAVFFFVNLCLGVVGTFVLQTRKRSEDAGVMRSFGATPSYIVKMMLGEGWLLTTVAWVVGCFLYLQYALAEGLAHTHNIADYYDYDPSWTSNFGIHFTVVSLVVYVMLLIVVTVGISIPASRISRVKPVDALRDE